MPQRENAERKTGRPSEDVDATENAVKAEPESRSNLTSDIDSILDEIDNVLEENAEDFVKSFVQKGGE
jgi:ubiquitin-like protein Pup